MKKVREITVEEENFRLEPFFKVPGAIGSVVKRDPVEPVPVGTYVAMVFRVTGYDADCDGSLMARLAHIDRDGEETGWCPHSLGLYPDSEVVLDSPDELHRIAEAQP